MQPKMEVRRSGCKEKTSNPGFKQDVSRHAHVGDVEKLGDAAEFWVS
jgi:hypothetical protein